jgi:hypothetical protein
MSSDAQRDHRIDAGGTTRGDERREQPCIRRPCW